MKLEMLTFAVAAMLVTPFAGLCQLNQGLIAWYPFNGNAIDASGNGLNGTLWNSPSFVAGPSPGTQAIYLVGQGEFGTSGQYVGIPSIDLSPFSGFTVSLWANIQGITGYADPGEGLISLGVQYFGMGQVVTIAYYPDDGQLTFIAGDARIDPVRLLYEPMASILVSFCKWSYDNLPRRTSLRYCRRYNGSFRWECWHGHSLVGRRRSLHALHRESI